MLGVLAWLLCLAFLVKTLESQSLNVDLHHVGGRDRSGRPSRPYYFFGEKLEHWIQWLGVLFAIRRGHLYQLSVRQINVLEYTNFKMNDFERHVFGRLDNLEAELAELREATWPVCQGLVDNRAGVFANVKEKRSFFNIFACRRRHASVASQGLVHGNRPRFSRRRVSTGPGNGTSAGRRVSVVLPSVWIPFSMKFSKVAGVWDAW